MYHTVGVVYNGEGYVCMETRGYWGYLCTFHTSLVAQTVKCLPTMWETRVQSLGWEDPLDSAFAYSPFEVVLRLPRPFYHDKHSLSQKWILRDHIKVVTLALKVRMFSSRNLIFTHLTHT